MKQLREIRENEKILIQYLLQLLELDVQNYPLPEMVDEYEGGKMGSISLGGDVDAYAGDLIQVEYIDSDQTPVVITLTRDSHGKLLDLDFWKTDFSRLITYPTPDRLILNKTL
ncbi:hypothetical protein DYBT9275_00575 [Dyadobacter sp. CECT 9275]|uniref:DUF6984 domain-containing protein n=1 Tax=Dyadobacter helix TaxID=2822344 RepID=A0A916N4B0_9BACT|nr:hypothetical protein [Dyadobacter sp. CECT 9275]CAG4990629.1 hypothetical protein DYBT9275_00575 [Dyadobacter sp. CECT 9275]